MSTAAAERTAAAPDPRDTSDRAAPSAGETAPKADNDLLCTLCGLRACWTPKAEQSS